MPKARPRPAPPAPPPPGAAAVAVTDAGTKAWLTRLASRKYVELARPLPFKELSANIEHGGRAYFFPLGSADPAMAAAKAKKIHDHVVRHGWDSALDTFPREMTFAVFWLGSPLVATYTTLFSEPGAALSRPPAPPAKPDFATRVLLIEPDPTQRRSLAHWLNQVAGYRCEATVPTVADAIKLSRTTPFDFVLINRLMPEVPLEEGLARLHEALPEAPAFPFGVYASSDDLFVGITGVASGYFLRRRAPLQVLEPLGAPRQGHRWSRTKAQAAARAYFMNLLNAPPPGEDSPDLPLTHREREMLEFLSRGFQDKEIAAALGISVWTVHTHMKSTFEKLGVHNRAEAVSRYLQK